MRNLRRKMRILWDLFILADEERLLFKLIIAHNVLLLKFFKQNCKFVLFIFIIVVWHLFKFTLIQHQREWWSTKCEKLLNFCLCRRSKTMNNCVDKFCKISSRTLIWVSRWVGAKWKLLKNHSRNERKLIMKHISMWWERTDGLKISNYVETSSGSRFKFIFLKFWVSLNFLLICC